MSIFHCQAKAISRSAGRSATAAAAYRSGERIIDERTGEVHDYRKKKGVIHKQIFVPKGCRGITRTALWNLAEVAENRKDAKVAREWEVALPAELNSYERRDVARYSMVWMALFGTQIGLRQGKQMSVEFFTSRYSERTIKYIDFFADFCCFGFALVTFVYSFKVLSMQLRSGQTSAALDIPMVYMYASVSISFFIMTVGKLFEMIRYFTTGQNPHRLKHEPEADASVLDQLGGGAS